MKVYEVRTRLIAGNHPDQDLYQHVVSPDDTLLSVARYIQIEQCEKNGSILVGVRELLDDVYSVVTPDNLVFVVDTKD